MQVAKAVNNISESALSNSNKSIQFSQLQKIIQICMAHMKTTTTTTTKNKKKQKKKQRKKQKEKMKNINICFYKSNKIFGCLMWREKFYFKKITI